MEINFNQESGEKNNSKKIILIVVAVILVLVLTVVASYFVALKTFEKSSGKASQKEIAQGEASQQAQENANKDFPVEEKVDTESSDVIKKGMVVWQEPMEMGDLGLAKKELYAGGNLDYKDEDSGREGSVTSEGIKYIKVGDVRSGKYTGGEIIDILAWVYEGPSFSPDLLRVLKFNNEYIFLTKNIRDGSEDYTKDFIKAYFFAGQSVKKINDDIVIQELVYPEKLQGSNERQNFTLDNSASLFFTSDKLKPAFLHSKFGQAWMTDGVKALNENPTPLELNSHASSGQPKQYFDIFNRGGFYLRAPDGTAVSYKLDLDIFDKQERFAKLQASWNDGTKNEIEYETLPSGCGLKNYVYDKTLNINLANDAVIVGKTDKGDNLYGFKDTTLQSFSELYENIYWVQNGNKKSKEEFLKDHPEVFWVDPFGRILAFYRSDIFSPAECGKPVIYLYPQEPMNVDVNVIPGGGISFSDPEYGQGWKVFSDQYSNIKNLADGKTYPYLFWEGSGSIYYETPKFGFSVTRENLNQFFDEKLSKLGLINKEIKDFKEYWIPKMLEENKPYYFVTFLSQRYIDKLAPLSVNPKPDTVIRILMDYRGLNEYQKFSEFKINTPERKGFTVVEWGGMLK